MDQTAIRPQHADHDARLRHDSFRHGSNTSVLFPTIRSTPSSTGRGDECREVDIRANGACDGIYGDHAGPYRIRSSDPGERDVGGSPKEEQRQTDFACKVQMDIVVAGIHVVYCFNVIDSGLVGPLAKYPVSYLAALGCS